MRFWLIDKIDSYVPGERLTARKHVTLTEEYLADHFPEFPVLPGVFMLEAATEAAAWLMRLSEDFAYSMITLHEAKNIKYADFVAPGSELTVEANIVKDAKPLTTFKVTGSVAGRTTLSGRILLKRYNLADEARDQGIEVATMADRADLDAQLRERFRRARQVIVSEGARDSSVS